MQEYCYVKIHSATNSVESVMGDLYLNRTPKNMLLHVVQDGDGHGDEIEETLDKYFQSVIPKDSSKREFLALSPRNHNGKEVFFLNEHDIEEMMNEELIRRYEEESWGRLVWISDALDHSIGYWLPVQQNRLVPSPLSPI